MPVICHNRAMIRIFKWLGFAAMALLLLLAAVVFGLQRWVGSADFRSRAEAQALAALGVPVRLGSIDVAVWPLPAVALGGLSVQSKPPVTLERVEVRPKWPALLRGRLEVATLVVRKAVLPQRGMDAILLALAKKKQTASPAAPAPKPVAGEVEAETDLSWLPRRTVLDDVTWVSESGAQTALDGEARLGDDGLPDSASLRLIRGNLQGLKAELKREPATAGAASAASAPVTPAGEQWALRIDVGGGKVEGKLGLQRIQAKNSRELVVQGQLTTQDVEVGALTAPNKPLSGRLEASTSLNARAATTAGLADALRTQTSFTVRNALLHGIDLAKAVKTVGLSRGGETPLDVLSGQVTTQGKAAQLANLVASSGILSASGNVAVSPAKVLSGHVSVSLAGDSKIGNALGGAVAVPLVVGGTLDAPEVTLSRSALLGAAIGTVLLPGAGTGAGARLGDRLGESFKQLFGK
jgi:uncharacterized protein involved in outer membrane biogenesis